MRLNPLKKNARKGPDRSDLFKAQSTCSLLPRPYSWAFTLIELLVVIAIIAILASMLLPALARAKSQSQSSKCQSNEKQIATSYIMYSQDNTDFLPGAAIPYSGGEAPLGWFVEISPYINNRDTNWDTFNQTNAMSAQATVAACPSANLQDAVMKTMPAYQAYGGYGHNYAFLCYDIYADPHVKLATVTKPATCCMNADALDPATGLQAWNFGYLYPPSGKPDGSTGGPYGYTRHDKGANYCWADGHVALTSWRVITNGQDGIVDWYYMPTPRSKQTSN